MSNTAARLAIFARRFEVCRFTIVVKGIDLTGVAMAMQLRTGRDVPGPPRVALATVTTAAAEGLKLNSVTWVDGIPWSVIKGRLNKSTMDDAVMVPYSGELGAPTVLAYAMQWTLSGDAQTRVYGDFVVEASAFGSDNAPTDRTPGYAAADFASASTSGTLQFGDQVVHVSIDGVDALAPLLATAADAASAAQDWAEQAEAAAGDALAVLDERMPTIDSPIYALAFQAGNGVTLGGIETDGTHRSAAIRTDKVNGLPAAGIITRRNTPRIYKPALHYWSWMGQSKMESSTSGGRFNVEQRYGMRAFPFHEANPTGLHPLLGTSQIVNGVTAYGGATVAFESPMHGIPYLGELAEKRDGVLLDEAMVRMVVANNATGSTSLLSNARGGNTQNFEHTIAQATRAKAIAASEGLPFICEAVSWSQGEGGSGASYDYADYKTKLKALAADLDTTIRGVTNGKPVSLLVTQTNAPTQGGPSTPGDSFPIARAQLDAYLDGGSRVVAVTPEYMVAQWNDALHYPTREALWLGAYDALAYDRFVFEGIEPAPLTFVVDSVIGNHVILRAIGAEGPLQIDIRHLPAQDDPDQGMLSGFTCRGAGNAITAVTSVEAGAGYVRVGLATAPGGKDLRYALNRAVGRGPFVGGCGNLRDSAGDSLPIFDGGGVNRRMHKWAMAQQWSL